MDLRRKEDKKTTDLLTMIEINVVEARMQKNRCI